MIGRIHHCSRTLSTRMSYSLYIVLVCMFSILFKPTSSGPVAERNDDVTHESDYNKKLVKNMFSIFSNIPNGFDPNEDPQLKIEHRKPSVICWTHIVTKMKNNKGDTVDQISEYAISFESPTNPDYNYVINSDPDVYGNTRTFFIAPPEIIYRNKDHIVQKNKYITCSFSSQYHKSYSKLPDGSVEIKIVKNNKKLLDNYAQEEPVPLPIPTEKPVSTIKVHPEYHQVVKKDEPVVENMPNLIHCNTHGVDKQSNEHDTPDGTIRRRMYDKSIESTNEEFSTEYLHQPTDVTTQCAEHTTPETKHIPTIIEPTNELPQINDDIERYPEVFPLKRIELVPSDDLVYKQHVYCQNISRHITAIRCPSDFISMPLINELRLPYYVQIQYSDITPDFTDANQIVVAGQRQCYLFEIVSETECPADNWKILTIYEPIKNEIPYPGLSEPEIKTDEDYSSAEQSTKTIDKNPDINTPLQITEKPELHTTVKPTTDISVDSFLIRIIKSNAPKDENNILEKCLEIDEHVSVIQCPARASLLPTINERILPSTVILNYLEYTPDIDDNKLIVRGEIFCYIFNKICEITCPADVYELFTVLEVDALVPTTTISATTPEVFEHLQPEIVTENNDPETTTVSIPEGFILRIAEVKIDSSEEESTLKVTCRYIDNHIFELDCPSEIPDLPYFDEYLFPYHVELDHIDKLPEITDKMLILRGNINCYILNMVNTTDCPSDPTKLLTLTILDNDEVESLKSPKSESQQLERKNSSPKPYDTNESEDESEDCDYVSAEDERTDKIPISTTMISYQPKYFQVRLINIVSFDKVAITCYNADKYITLLNCPKTGEKIPEFDVEKLPSDTIILDEMGKEILLNKNQMIVKGKGYCYALTKLNMEKCPIDGQRRMVNIIDCNIDSESHESFRIEPINSLENLLNPSFPVAFEVMHISQRPDIPTYISVTCENMNGNIGIVKCPTGFFRIPIVNESLLAKYPSRTYENMPELNENMVLAKGKRVCYILEKIGQIECPKDLNKMVRILTHDVIENEEPRSSTEYSQNTETVIKRLDETTEKIFSTSSKPIEEELRTSTEYLENIETISNKLYESTTERTSTSSGTTKETVFGEEENNFFPVAIKVLHIPLQSNISPNLTVTCENVNSNVAIIDCPTEFEQIPFINEQLLAKYAKQLIHKNITEFSENMLLVRGKKDCYILDQIGETECPQHLHGIVIIFTSHVIQPEDVQTSTEYLQNIETTTSRPTEVEPSTLTKNLQYTTNELYESTSKIPSTGRPIENIDTTTNKLHKSTAKIISTTSKSEEEEPRTSISDIETTINKSHETTTKIPSTSNRPLDEEPKTSTKYLQYTETTTNKLHETTTRIPSTSSKAEKEEPRTTTEYLQDIETTTNKLHETTTKIPSTSSKPIEDGPRTTTEYLQEIETIINKLHETTTEIISTTTTKDENITFPVALEILHISPNITIPTHMTVTCENINGKITVINCPSGFQTIPTVNENLLPEYTKQEFHNNIPEINDNMLLVRGTKYCYIFDKIGKIECPADMSKIINILKYEEIEPVKPQEIETTTIVPTTPGELSEEIKLTDEETFPIAIHVEHISTQSNRPSYMAVHCENINRIINVIKCPKNFKKFPVINRKLLTKYITDIIPIKKPQLNDSMLLVRGNKGCYILHRIGEVKCPKPMNNILKIFTYTFAEYLPNIDITTYTSITENSPTSNKINYEPIQVTESIPLNDSDQDGTSTESKATTSNLKVTEASTTIDTKITNEETTVKAHSENDEQNNEDNTGSTLHTTSVTEPTTTTMMDNEYNHEFVTTKSIKLTTILKDNTVASTATDIPETHQEGITTNKSLSESSDNLAITVSSTTEQTTIENNLSSLDSSTMPNTSTNEESTETLIADETIPTSSTNAAVSTSISDTEVTEMSQSNHELTTVKTTTETETTSPILTETTNPINVETNSPIDVETTSPTITETTSLIDAETTSLIDAATTSPINAETTSAIVTETISPIDAKTTSPTVTESTSSIYVKTTSPIDDETTSGIDAETTSPTVTEITSLIDAETTIPIVTEISSPIDSKTTSPTITETTTLIVTEITSPIVTEITSPLDAETTSPIDAETTSPIDAETTSLIDAETTSPIDTEITSPIVTETTSQNMNDENEIDSSTEINLNTKQPNETTIFDSVTGTKPILVSSTEATNLPDDVHTTTPDNIVDNSHIISEKLTTPNTDKSQLTEHYTTERYTTSRSTALWDDTSSDFIDTTTNYEVTTIAETVAGNTTESKITVNEHTSVSDTVSTDTTLKVDENTTDTTPEKENAKDVITIPVVDTITTDNTLTDLEKIITEQITEYIPITEKTVLVHQMVSSTNSPVQNETKTESLFSNTGEEENTKYTTVNGATTNNIIADLNESTTDSVDDLNREHIKPVSVQNISTLSHSIISEDVTTEKSKNNIVVSPDEANIDTEDEVDDDYDDDEPIIDDDLAEYLLKNKLHGNRRSKFSPLKKRGRKNKRFHKFKRNRIGYKSKARVAPVGPGNRGNVHYNTESYTSKEKMMGHAAAYIKIHSPNNTNVTKTQKQNYTTVIYKYSDMNHPIPVAVRVNDDISTRLLKQRFPVKITNVFGLELTQMVCKYVDKNIKLINISTEIANLPFMNDGLLPRDVNIEYNEKLPPIMGNNNLLVRGMFYYYLLKEYNTIPCPENTNNFVPITMYYNGMKPTTPTNVITRNTNSVSKVLDNFKSAAVGQESDVQRINYNDTVMNTAIARRRKLTKFNVKFTIVGVPGHDITTCGHIEENMTVVDEQGRTETVSIGMISSKERLYYEPYVPFQLPKDTLAVRSNDMWYVFRGYKEFKCPEDTSIFITLTLHYNNHLRRTKLDLPQISHFPVKIINIPNPNKIQITCKLMEPTVTQINLPTTVESENVAFMNISLLPDNVIINRRELSSMTIDEKSILVQNNGMYYILTEYKTIECPKNIDNFVPIILYQNDVSLPNANERNWKYALGEKERTSSAFQQPSKTQHTNVESQTAGVIHETEIFKPKLNVDDELSVIPLVQETGTQRTKKEIVPLKQQEMEHQPLPIVHTLNPSIPEQEVVSTTIKSYVNNYPIPEQVILSTTPNSYVTNNPIPKSTEGPMLPTPEYLSSVVVKHNNIENKEDCYEVNNRMQVNKIPCPKDTSTIPHVINPEFMKLLCPKKLRPKLKYMTGLGILRKLNMIIHDPNKQKNVN